MPLRRRQAERELRRRRLAVVIALFVVGLLTLLFTAFGGSDHPAFSSSPPASAARLVPPGPPSPQIVAHLGALRLQLPINQSRVTAIGYHGGTDGALALGPVGTQANQGLVRRIWHAIVGGGSGGQKWYQLGGGEGPPTSELDVGAPPGTDVYSPVDGTIVGIDKLVLNGKTFNGEQIDIQPVELPSVIVSVAQVKVDPSLTVGSMVTAGSSKLGEVLDLAALEQQALARYTNDAGDHAVVEVRQATRLAIL
jgi:hypothetical protein